MNNEELQRLVYEAFTRFNYFSNQRKGVSKLPPSIST